MTLTSSISVHSWITSGLGPDDVIRGLAGPIQIVSSTDRLRSPDPRCKPDIARKIPPDPGAVRPIPNVLRDCAPDSVSWPAVSVSALPVPAAPPAFGVDTRFGGNKWFYSRPHSASTFCLLPKCGQVMYPPMRKFDRRGENEHI